MGGACQVGAEIVQNRRVVGRFPLRLRRLRGGVSLFVHRVSRRGFVFIFVLLVLVRKTEAGLYVRFLSLLGEQVQDVCIMDAVFL